MLKKLTSVLVALVMVMSVSVPAAFVQVSASTVPESWDFERYGDVIDIGTSMRMLESDENYIANLTDELIAQAKEMGIYMAGDPKAPEGDPKDGDVPSDDAAADSDFTYDGGTKTFLGYRNGSYYLKDYTLRSVGENVEVWVADNLDFPTGDSRPAPIITQDQVDKVRDEFDGVIYEKDTQFFGMPDSLTGENSVLAEILGLPEDYYAPIDGHERVIILVDNVRDENYYDPDYPFFVAGFYSSTYELYFDRNIITIDTNNWETRLENTFLPTVAHEFQHLIHDDNDSDEETWVNEGMSDFAEYLCGYGQPWGHINFFLDHPENSLVSWDEHYYAETGPETLADYGQAYLITYYMYEKFGQDFIQSLAKDSDNGIESVEKILDEYGTGIDFEELFRRFTIAVAIDNEKPDNGIYSFDTVDLEVDYESAAYYNKPGVPAWGADYIAMDDTEKIKSILFDGIDFLPIPWKVVEDPLGSGEMVLWGNQGDEIDNKVLFEADLTNVGTATLKFDHYYNIEEAWDYGFVQVSTDNGQTWESLANGNTRTDLDPHGYPAISENLPGFTGTNEVWATEEFDLTPYAGNKVVVAFRYMTDWGYNEAGWFIKNIQVPEIDLTMDTSSIDNFINYDELLDITVDYAVAFINEKSAGKSDNAHIKVLNIDPFNITEEDSLQLRGFMNNGDNYMIVWYAAPVGNKGAVDYSYELQYRGNKEKSKYENGNIERVRKNK